MKMAVNSVAQTDAVKVASPAPSTNANQTQSAAKEPTPAKTQPAVKDTVQISSAAEEAAKMAQQGNKQSSILQPK
jgi:hypothetical protein